MSLLEFADFGFPGCWQCDGAGLIITCPDDLCRGAGECIHGDGYSPCPQCAQWEAEGRDLDECDYEYLGEAP